jgi:hypothetical protein
LICSADCFLIEREREREEIAMLKGKKKEKEAAIAKKKEDQKAKYSVNTVAGLIDPGFTHGTIWISFAPVYKAEQETEYRKREFSDWETSYCCMTCGIDTPEEVKELILCLNLHGWLSLLL